MRREVKMRVNDKSKGEKHDIPPLVFWLFPLNSCFPGLKD